MKAPHWHVGQRMDGEWNGEARSFQGKALPVYNLTWTQLWRLFWLRLLSPRASTFKIAIVDYGYED